MMNRITGSDNLTLWQKTSVPSQTKAKQALAGGDAPQTHSTGKAIAADRALGDDSIGGSDTLGKGDAPASQTKGIDTYTLEDLDRGATNPYASTIVNSIQAQLQRDSADGATSAQLAARLEAGLQGFLDGFSGAYDHLSDSGLLSDEVNNAIQQTRTQVLQHIGKLSQQLGVDNPLKNMPKYASNARDQEQGSVEQGPDVKQVNERQQSLLAEWAPAGSEALNQAQQLDIPEGVGNTLVQSQDTYVHLGHKRHGSVRSSEAYVGAGPHLDATKVNESTASTFSAAQLSFDIRTREGDSVTFYYESQRTSGLAQDTSYTLSENFLVHVSGHLDTQELEAINSLVAKVKDVSAEFFHGDLESAFIKALELGYDHKEIAFYSLGLTHVSLVASQPQQSYAQAITADPALAPLNQFAEQLLALATEAESMGFERAIIEDLARAVESFTRPSEQRFSTFVAHVLEFASAPQSR